MVACLDECSFYALASRLAKREKTEETPDNADTSPSEPSTEIDLGWTAVGPKKKSRRKSSSNHAIEPIDEDAEPSEENSESHLAKRRRLLKELSARLERDRQLRYAEREFEMQRQMMGKGGRKKIQGVEKVEGDDGDEDEDQDEIDARHGKRRPSSRQVDEATYRPRVYKWRLERK